MAKNLDLSYSVVRRLCINYIGFETRRGTSVVTDALRAKRRENVLGEKSPWFDWPRKMPEMTAKNGKSIQGYYSRASAGEYVWLRSTYEYIYAKWLDQLGVRWEIEKTSFPLSNGENYRPDFFIYDDSGELKTIVEVKSRYFNKGNREYKFDLFKLEYCGVNCSIITNMDLYTKIGYQKELKEWKSKRISSRDELDQLR